MKNLRSALLALTVLLLATVAHAQQTNVKADVPFDFIAGDRAYPAGEYTVKSIAASGIAILIDNTQEPERGLVLSNACLRGQPSAETKLVFERMGDHYFLSQIWTEGNSAGREFPRSKAETQLAQNHQKPNLVIVAANISH
jgi:hypothetical protein